MNNKWDEFQITPSKKFGLEVPIFQPSVFREYRGEIFTTFHSNEHPVMNYISEGCEIHGRFSRSYKGVLRGLHWDNKTWKLVQAAVGDIYLIVLDMRENSSTFGEWEPLTLGQGGLYHLSMGAILGVSSWSRGQEKMKQMEVLTNNQK